MAKNTLHNRLSYLNDDVSGEQKQEKPKRSIIKKKEKPNLKNQINNIQTEPQQITSVQQINHSELEIEEYSDEILTNIEIKEKKLKSKNMNMRRALYKAGNIFLVALSLYMVFLIYGVFVTNYVYTDNGSVEPEVMSVSELRAYNEYLVILNEYYKAQELYEEILVLDYRVSTGLEDYRVLATEYNGLLDKVSTLSVGISALDVKTEYQTIQLMLQNWIEKDAGLYLEYINVAISDDSTYAMQQAIGYRDSMYTDFMKINSNIVSIGNNTKGCEMSEVSTWSPDKFLEQEYGVVK